MDSSVQQDLSWHELARPHQNPQTELVQLVSAGSWVQRHWCPVMTNETSVLLVCFTAGCLSCKFSCYGIGTVVGGEAVGQFNILWCFCLAGRVLPFPLWVQLYNTNLWPVSGNPLPTLEEISTLDTSWSFDTLDDAFLNAQVISGMAMSRNRGTHLFQAKHWKMDELFVFVFYFTITWRRVLLPFSEIRSIHFYMWVSAA